MSGIRTEAGRSVPWGGARSIPRGGRDFHALDADVPAERALQAQLARRRDRGSRLVAKQRRPAARQPILEIVIAVPRHAAHEPHKEQPRRFRGDQPENMDGMQRQPPLAEGLLVRPGAILVAQAL